MKTHKIGIINNAIDYLIKMNYCVFNYNDIKGIEQNPIERNINRLH